MTAQRPPQRATAYSVGSGDLREPSHARVLPLSEAPIDRVTAFEWGQNQGDIFDAIADEDDEMDGCSPFTCRTDLPGQGDETGEDAA